MAGLLSKANKRKCYPVTLEDRTVHVRALKDLEIERMGVLPSNLKAAFVMGCCLCLEAGEIECPKINTESDEEYATRVRMALDAADVDTEMMGKLSQAIGKIGHVNVEDIAKNSEPTAKPDSQEG